MNDAAPESDWVRAAEAARRGEPIVVPTDTVYGLGAVLSAPGAIDELFALKGRSFAQPLAVLVADADQAAELGRLDAAARAVVERFWPGPLTVVVPRRTAVELRLGGSDDTVGLRCPDHGPLRNLLATVGPMAFTSANRSGEPTPTTAAGVREQLGDAVVVVDGGTLVDAASTVADLTGELVVLRVGPISVAELRAVLDARP
jgi:L-threonylcarbamoyladenylate synthase